MLDGELIEEERSRLPERVFRQEFGAEFLEGSGAVFRGVRDVATGEWQAPIPGQRYVAGLDLAKVEDYTVLVVMTPSRDGRSDCKQVTIGLVVSREGYPVGYEVFDGNRVDVTTVLERHSRAAKRFEVEVVYDLSRKSEVRLEWRERKDWRQWAELTEGTYILRTNVADWSDEELWRTYVQLWQAEAAFRISKSDLSLRPIWHQRADRVQAHILVCFLALCLWKTLEGWQAQAGLGNSPRTLLEELKRIQCVDVVLPILDGPELRLRCVVEPDPDLASLLERLGLTLPKRLRAPLQVGVM